MPFVRSAVPSTIGDPNSNNPKAAWCCRSQDEEGLQALREHLGSEFEDITAASFETETGDYENICVSWGQPSYLADNIYYRVEWQEPIYMGHILNGNEHAKSAFILNAETLQEVWDAAPQNSFDAFGAFDQNGTCVAILYQEMLFHPHRKRTDDEL